jgi:hypothetical protein
MTFTQAFRSAIRRPLALAVLAAGGLGTDLAVTGGSDWRRVAGAAAAILGLPLGVRLIRRKA